MQNEDKYIYCIKDGNEKEEFGPIGIGGRRDRVYTIVYKDIAAVVSDSPFSEYPVSKENTLSHMRVLELIMKNNTVLPAKFSTVAHKSKSQSTEETIRSKVLMIRYKELKELLTQMANKVELGVKAMWVDMENVYREIVENNKEISTLKRRLSQENSPHSFSHRVNLGKMVKSALETKRSAEEQRILKAFGGEYFESRCNKTFGDAMITNSCYLVGKSRLEEFDKRIEKLVLDYMESIKFRYIGPVPPCNFVELTINL